MSDRMCPIPFSSLLDWIFTEYKNGSVFGCKKFFKADSSKTLPIFGGRIETPFGPAAGPHTQLAQNIVSAYVGGARFFELKTVQELDGDDLHVSKPCILAEDEGYNCEWSTELTVKQAFEEYVKAWFALKVISKEFSLGGMNNFVFNMSVGYSLEGIKSKKVDGFIEGLKHASGTDIFKECKEELLRRLPVFSFVTADDINSISGNICNNITLSTMHGCPADEIEKMVLYMIEEKKLNTYLKCNPTLLGYDKVRGILNNLGYNYMVFDDSQFKSDLKFDEAVAMLKRLCEKAAKEELVFGAKLTNTFPVKATKWELPDEMMYMSGRSLMPLTLGIAEKLSRAFNGKLPISYSGGADVLNIESIFETGIMPITVCTDLLKPGGYHRLFTMAQRLSAHSYKTSGTTDSNAIKKLLAETLDGSRCKKLAPFTIKRKPVKEYAEHLVTCRNVCGCCSTVCPNRANVIISVPDGQRMLHIDGLCNECGNCASFCLEGRSPYLEKFTLFTDHAALESSRNDGFAPLDESCSKFTVRINDNCSEYSIGQTSSLPAGVLNIINTVKKNYSYLFYTSRESR